MNMYLLIQAHQYDRYKDLLAQSYRLRKRVFADQLGWSVSVVGDYEKDRYDSHNPAYFMWCDDDALTLYGCVRLMPTTGPTLLYYVFRSTFPNACDLVAPSIWEGTRMCVDDVAISRDMPDLKPDRAFCLLLLALCEVAMSNGIDTLVSNYEPHMRRLYRRAGAEFEEVGRADGFGRLPVCCGLFEVSARILSKMRAALQVTHPLYGFRQPMPDSNSSSHVTRLQFDDRWRRPYLDGEGTRGHGQKKTTTFSTEPAASSSRG
jgi:acyl homoserine lactone synthase